MGPPLSPVYFCAQGLAHGIGHRQTACFVSQARTPRAIRKDGCSGYKQGNLEVRYRSEQTDFGALIVARWDRPVGEG